MIGFPNAKINLGLRILGTRPDGFHEINSVFYPVGLCDILEITVAGDGIFSFETSGLFIPGNPDDNLCVRAYRMLREDLVLPPVKIFLHKVIPMGAGTGGGSSNGAFTLKILNEMFSLALPEDRMMNYAGRLGSDCPFFIRNHAMHVEGRGDRMSPLTLDLTQFKTVIVVPDIHINTSEAYTWLDSYIAEGRHKDNVNAFTDLSRPVGEWKDFLVNDFEMPVFSKHPVIRNIKELLYKKGAVYASMSGSGAAVYGLFKEELTDLSGFENCFVWVG